MKSAARIVAPARIERADGTFGNFERDIATTPSYSGDEREANARLIAAAPEMLEALEDCVELLQHLGAHSGPDTILDAARATLAKARGQS